ncbi:complement C1s subcomponent [Culex quinquefasciatus]|uniref:Complement C1s subcomponent n=1 Tax=Culex quinquefasciatus TaxID=7176 RepID=B0WSD6_CULQU|nr:complement C1s subcomponent [Culex quinquefasciatus]|eukprot:XP_001851819.1 complement C1s subcomponent [Culex quinquefasciatus]
MEIKEAGFLVAFLLLLCCTDAFDFPEPGTCGLDASDRIYGGTITKPDSYPWTAILIYWRRFSRSDLFQCGGTLISDQYVLTAAHCLDDPLIYSLNRVRLGDWDLQSEEDCDDLGNCNDPPLDVGIESFVQHEKYNRKTMSNDIGLIKLKEKVIFTEFVLPICLPIAESVKNQNTDSMNFIAVGWGVTEHGNGTKAFASRYKLHVELPGTNLTYCSKVYKEDDIAEAQMCAGAERGKDTCVGDSGGGLFAQVDGIYYEYGIISFGNGCGVKGVPGINTRVTSYLNWIEGHMSD